MTTTQNTTTYEIHPHGARFSAIMNKAAKLGPPQLTWDTKRRMYLTGDAEIAASFRRLGAKVREAGA